MALRKPKPTALRIWKAIREKKTEYEGAGDCKGNARLSEVAASGGEGRVEDAVKKTGLSAELVVRISASAGALYQIGKIKIINLCEFDDYIWSFPVICNMDNLESKRLRGSKFVREIYRNRQKRLGVIRFYTTGSMTKEVSDNKMIREVV